MSKSNAKKPVLSDEERRARMAALTSDVAAINLLDGGNMPVATPAPAPAATMPAAESTPPAPVAPVASTATAAPASPEPVIAPQPASSPKAASPDASRSTASAASAADEEAEPVDRGGEELPTATAPAGSGELDVAALFAPATGKKDTTLRITAAHQQFFSQLGVVLGNGASAPDIIHNILTQFRAQHEATLSRLVRRALSKQFR